MLRCCLQPSWRHILHIVHKSKQWAHCFVRIQTLFNAATKLSTIGKNTTVLNLSRGESWVSSEDPSYRVIFTLLCRFRMLASRYSSFSVSFSPFLQIFQFGSSVLQHIFLVSVANSPHYWDPNSHVVMPYSWGWSYFSRSLLARAQPARLFRRDREGFCGALEHPGPQKPRALGCSLLSLLYDPALHICRCISPKIFEFSLIKDTFRLNWENFDPINRKLTQLTEICISSNGMTSLQEEMTQLSIWPD